MLHPKQSLPPGETKRVYTFGGIRNKTYAAEIENQNVNLSLKVSLDEKILFDDITRLIEPEIRKILEKELYGNKRFHIPSWSVIYLLMKLEFISKTDNGIKFEFQRLINHGPECNMTNH